MIRKIKTTWASVTKGDCVLAQTFTGERPRERTVQHIERAYSFNGNSTSAQLPFVVRFDGDYQVHLYDHAQAITLLVNQ